MRQLGFKYEVRKKTYYVDSHEKTGNVIYWVNFIQRYFGYELRAHRWIPIIKVESDALVFANEICENIRHEYEQQDENGNKITYIEYHVDDHPLFQDR